MKSKKMETENKKMVGGPFFCQSLIFSLAQMAKEKLPNFLQRNLGFICFLFVLPPFLAHAFGFSLFGTEKFVWLSHPVVINQGSNISQSSDGRPTFEGQTLYTRGPPLFSLMKYFRWIPEQFLTRPTSPPSFGSRSFFSNSLDLLSGISLMTRDNLRITFSWLLLNFSFFFPSRS